MSTKNKKKKEEESSLNLDHLIKKVVGFYEREQRVINIVSAAVVIVLALSLAYFLYYVPKQQEKAEISIFKAERYFGMDSLQLALNGDGDHMGLLSVIDEYGRTPSGNRAKYMAGICYLKLGQFDEAITWLKKVNLKDKLISGQALGSLGDAYMENNDLENAMKYYKKAVSQNPNEIVTPVYLLRLGWLCEMQGLWKDAVSYYETLQHEYAQPQSQSQPFEVMDIEKRIAFAKTKISK